MNRVERKNAQPIGDAIREYLRQCKLASGLNTQRVFAAWDDASGAAPYTVRRFFRDGKLYITLSSSVVRSQLYFQKDALVEKINAMLAKDELYDPDDKFACPVKELILK